MTTHDPVPTSPDGEEPLSKLFSDMLNLADQVSSRITDDEVETRLRRVLRRARQCGPAGGDSAPLTVPFDPAEAILCGQPPSELLEAQLREVLHSIARTRSELAAMGTEARRTLELAKAAYAEAEKVHADAMAAYDDATKAMSEARDYHDAALDSAASIVKEAKTAAEDIKQAAREAADHWRDDFTAEQAAKPHAVLLFDAGTAEQPQQAYPFTGQHDTVALLALCLAGFEPAHGEPPMGCELNACDRSLVLFASGLAATSSYFNHYDDAERSGLPLPSILKSPQMHAVRRLMSTSNLTEHRCRSHAGSRQCDSEEFTGSN